MRVLVTGARGFIGTHVVAELVGRGHEVVAAMRPGTLGGDLPPGVEPVEVDLFDARSAARMVDAATPDATIHLAWYVEPGRYLHAVPENLESLEASARLLRLLAEQDSGPVVLGGTSFEAAAGGAAGGVYPRQASIYATAKGAVHDLAERLAAEGHPVACAHIFYVYGPGERRERLVPLLIRSLLRGEPISVTDGRQERDYLHVADVAAALCTIAEAGGAGSFDICGPEPMRLREVYDAVGRATGRGDLIDVGGRPYGDGEVLRAAGDDRALRALGWTPTRPLQAGIDDTVAWWRASTDVSGVGEAVR